MVRIKDAKKNVIVFFCDVAFTKLFIKKKKKQKTKFRKTKFRKSLKIEAWEVKLHLPLVLVLVPPLDPSLSLSLKSPLLAQLLR